LSRLKLTLKSPLQIQKPPRVCLVVHKDSDFESEDKDDHDAHPRDGEGKWPLTTRQAVLASVVEPSHVSLGVQSQTFLPVFAQVF
jgi:hypothetical protein